MQELEPIVIVHGEIQGKDNVLVRVHDQCFTSEVLGSLRCDCGEQLDHALKLISEKKRGAILYLRQEGRGIGLVNKIRAYNLQDKGADTVEANERLGFGADLRDYSICGPMLKHIGTKEVILMTNNPKKIKAIEDLGVKVEKSHPIIKKSNPHNDKYLSTKSGKLGHLI